MKHYLLSLGILLQAWSGFGQEALYMYTFSGSISSLYYDGGGILAARNVAVGDPVAASYIVDFGAPGFSRLNNGSIDFPTDPPLGNVHTEAFYCRLASGTLLPEANGGVNNRPQDVAEYFTGWNQSSPMGNEGLLWGGTGDSYFTVRKSSFTTESRVQEWQVGTEVQGIIVAYSDQDWSVAWANLRLDSIAAVPEPSVMSVVAIGGVAWGYFRGRQRG